jgi:acetamidase/formamidase
MTNEQMKILELLSSEDAANVKLGLDLMKSQNITIPILEKFKKVLDFIGTNVESEFWHYNYYCNDNYNQDEKEVSYNALKGIGDLLCNDDSLSVFTLDVKFEEMGIDA